MERLMEYLPSNVPIDETSCIVHGDYRMGNLLAHPTELSVAALLDWELSTFGHPLDISITAACPIKTKM
jgi:aminoglycoside phosphotransferase (APT) family kinase protein